MKCLDSLTAQTYKPTVVYIVDNASTDKVVMTDKVFTENRYKKGNQHLLDKLSELFEHEVITIPWDSPGTCDPDSDKYGFGHADGFIKYAGDHHILMSNIR